MRKFAFVLAAVVFGGPAFAADMAVKALTPAPPSTPFSWTGFYVGGNVGYSWGSPNSQYVFTNAIGATPLLALAHSNALNFTGAVGGAQVGYNWQTPSRWVLGVEADWQGSSERARRGYSDPYGFTVPGIGLQTGAVTTNYDAKILWLGTVRGRIGYAWDHLLVYGTGGLAYGDVKFSGTVNDAGILAGVPFSGTSTFGASRVNVGWTVGGGIEGALAHNWSWKAEYLYVDLGSLSFFGGGPFPANPQTVAVQAKFTDNIVRVGLNYQFR